MPTTGRAEPEILASLSLTLPDDAAALCRQSGDLFSSPAWWQVVQAHAMPSGATPLFVVARAAEQCVAILALLRQQGRLRSLTTPYSCLFSPVLPHALSEPHRTEALQACLQICRSVGVTRLDAIPEDWPALPNLRQAARRCGLHVLPFAHFGNWYEDTGGLDWTAYLRQRPGPLRETIRRRLRKAENMPGARFALFTDAAQATCAAALYEQVYQRSWKQPEPFPTFNTALIHASAQQGWLRLGVWSLDGQPVAAQFWVVTDGHAIVLKLAHDEALKTHSPGTVLTAMMLRHLLDQERVTQIDFGRGDDPYKQGWVSARRQRIGLLLVNPRRPLGAAALLTDMAGSVWRGLRRGRCG